MALSDHFGATPSAVCQAVLTALSQFQFADGGAGVDGGSGCVKTIKRIAGDELKPENIDRHLTSGMPALLVAHLLGKFGAGRTNRKLFDQTIRLAIVCCAGRFSSQADRLAGGVTATVNPGVEDLLDWATYFALRALEQLSGCREQQPVDQVWLRLEPGKYIARVDIECKRTFDAWDDAPASTLQTLGIVHDPIDLDDLWAEDNETPKSELPSALAGGVTDL